MNARRALLPVFLVSAYIAVVATSFNPTPQRIPSGPVPPFAPPKESAEVLDALKEVDLKVTCEAPIFKAAGQRTLLRVLGTTSLPEGSLLMCRLSRTVETERGGALIAAPEMAGSGAVEVIDRSFSCELAVSDPGTYVVQIEWRDELQEKKIIEQVRKTSALRRWEFTFDLWGDEFLTPLKPELAEVEAVAHDLEELYTLREAATSTKDLWIDQKPLLLEQARRLIALAEARGRRSLYPAARHELSSAARWLAYVGLAAPWSPAGAMVGALDRHTGKWMEIRPNERSSLMSMQEFLDRVVHIAHREYGLWVMKDLRRSGRRSSFQAAARGAPSSIQPMLMAAKKTADLSPLEKWLRGKEVAGADQPELLSPAPVHGFVPDLEFRVTLEDARRLLDRADLLWQRADDHEATALYKRLLKDYPAAVDALQARVRVSHRALQEDK